ncbi:hypothetical protein AAJ72_08430 [Citromicrobium sp. RCC1885]|nr:MULTISPECIES: hypothetical protein [unclassified Citromicrobium]KPM25641.1 hypothetical protein AAJ72_08430 [Citromicrobium sp. RCC1885]KPM28883.1 hypothetical protein AAJ74_09170 [Citromicrobium sp. RCC1878]OAM09565.1 hypothetical protein A0U43_00260 [Citromicrobium sp. RCC1897]
MTLLLALGPAARQRLAAIPALDEASEREVGAVVLAHDALRRAVEALLYRLKGLEVDQGRMMTGTQ